LRLSAAPASLIFCSRARAAGYSWSRPVCLPARLAR
jgi:hypothetical protein